jgi:hypothetical protein
MVGTYLAFFHKIIDTFITFAKNTLCYKYVYNYLNVISTLNSNSISFKITQKRQSIAVFNVFLRQSTNT